MLLSYEAFKTEFDKGIAKSIAAHEAECDRIKANPDKLRNSDIVNGVGIIQEMATGFPGYNGMIPRENGFLSEILLDAGYATFAIGNAGAANAALFAVAMLATGNPALLAQLEAFRARQTAAAQAMSAELI